MIESRKRSHRVDEGVTSFLRAIHGDDYCRNDTRVRDEVRREFLENAVGIATGIARDYPGNSTAGHLADGEVHAFFGELVEAVFIEVGGRQLFRLGIDEAGLLGKLLAVLCPHGVGVTKHSGLVAHNHHDGEIVVFQSVGLVIRGEIIRRELETYRQTIGCGRVKNETMLAGNLIEPVILAVAGGSPWRIGGYLRDCSGSASGRRAQDAGSESQASEKRPASD